MHFGKIKRTPLFFCFLFLFIGMNAPAQRLAVDTLLGHLKSNKVDTTRWLIQQSLLPTEKCIDGTPARLKGNA